MSVTTIIQFIISFAYIVKIYSFMFTFKLSVNNNLQLNVDKIEDLDCNNFINRIGDDEFMNAYAYSFLMHKYEKCKENNDKEKSKIELEDEQWTWGEVPWELYNSTIKIKNN